MMCFHAMLGPFLFNCNRSDFHRSLQLSSSGFCWPAGSTHETGELSAAIALSSWHSQMKISMGTQGVLLIKQAVVTSSVRKHVQTMPVLDPFNGR